MVTEYLAKRFTVSVVNLAVKWFGTRGCIEPLGRQRAETQRQDRDASCDVETRETHLSQGIHHDGS